MSVQISRILHAGYIFESQGTRLVFDPLFESPFSRNCYAFPDVEFDTDFIRKQRFSAVILSHYHDDHCSLESLDLIHRATPIYIYCLHADVLDLLRDMGFESVHTININKPIPIGPFRVTPRRALDRDVDCVLQVQTDTLNILNVVDAWIDEDTLRLLESQPPWDLIAWPLQTFREYDVLSPFRAQPASEHVPEEWLTQLQRLQPRALIPSACQFRMEEWSWYNSYFFPISYKNFVRETSALLPHARIEKLSPGKSLLLTNSHIAHGPLWPGVNCLNDDVDYHFDPQLKPPPTSMVARALNSLDPTSCAQIYNYLHSQIQTAWSKIERLPDDYFYGSRLWHLTVWESQETGRDFYFKLSANAMELLVDPPDSFAEIAWRTEIPATTLYGALARGESLISLYIRINDRPFSVHLERELEAVDLLSDPLLQCLYGPESIASYQKAQLQRLLNKKHSMTRDVPNRR